MFALNCDITQLITCVVIMMMLWEGLSYPGSCETINLSSRTSSQPCPAAAGALGIPLTCYDLCQRWSLLDPRSWAHDRSPRLSEASSPSTSSPGMTATPTFAEPPDTKHGGNRNLTCNQNVPPLPGGWIKRPVHGLATRHPVGSSKQHTIKQEALTEYP